MSQCKACGAKADPVESEEVIELCSGCTPKKLSCRVCGYEFTYLDILARLPIVQCPTCEGSAIDELE